MESLMQYQRVLQQRNAWLKQEAAKPKNDYTTLDFYNEKLAADGTYIYQGRQRLLKELLPLLNEYYHRLSQGREELGVQYNSHLHTAPMDKLLKDSLPHDLQLQRTLKGIHRDDWDFTLDGLALKQYASQGQKKSFLFALKLAQYTYLEQQQGGRPMLLLDDIFEKLDNGRIRALLAIISSPSGAGQVFLTDTDKARVAEAFGGVEVGYIEV